MPADLLPKASRKKLISGLPRRYPRRYPRAYQKILYLYFNNLQRNTRHLKLKVRRMEITKYQRLTAHESTNPGKVSKPPFTKIPGSAAWRLQNRPARLDRLEPYTCRLLSAPRWPAFGQATERGLAELVSWQRGYGPRSF